MKKSYSWIGYLLSVFVSSISASSFTPVTFDALPGWQHGKPLAAFQAFKASCEKMQNDTKYAQWQAVCQTAVSTPITSNTKARDFFQTFFTPYEMGEEGLFTGYYLPEIPASLMKTVDYPAPIYSRPTDLVSVSLGDFFSDLHGKTFVGKVVNGRLIPYQMPRSAINRGALNLQAKILAWTDPVDLFILQIQGSGRLRLNNHQEMMLGFDGKNGSPYLPIGKLLVEKNLLAKDNVSMQTIREYLKAHPLQAQTLMEEDASYVFFRKLYAEPVIGSQNVALTPGISLAVDPHYILLGTPIWLNTEYPGSQKIKPLQRLMVAQDTGGAIRGRVRADVYWGAGDEAEWIAGHMKSQGHYWLLLPKTVLATTR